MIQIMFYCEQRLLEKGANLLELLFRPGRNGFHGSHEHSLSFGELSTPNLATIFAVRWANEFDQMSGRIRDLSAMKAHGCSMVLLLSVCTFLLDGNPLFHPVEGAPVPGGLQESLLLYLPFDGDAKDVSGYNRHGMVEGAVLAEDRFGQAASAYRVTGSAFIRVEDLDPDDYAQGFSFGGWIKVETFGTGSMFYWLEDGGWGSTYILLDVGPGALRVRCGSGSPVTAHELSGLPLYQDRWHHLFVTHGPAVDRIYIDGEMAGEWPTLPLRSNTSTLRIGWNGSWSAVVDEIAVYGRELLPEEIGGLASGQFPDSAPAILSQPGIGWAFEGDTATFAAAVYGKPAPTLQWQRSVDGGSSWLNLVDGGSISGATSRVLAVANVSQAMNGHLFRYTAVNPEGMVTSQPGELRLKREVHYIDWISATVGVPGSAIGWISLPGDLKVEVSYTGDVFQATQVQNGPVNYWVPSGAYLSETVPNAPATTDIITLVGGGEGLNTIEFSRPVKDPILLVVSLGNDLLEVTYAFDRPFIILSAGAGYWGGGPDRLNQVGNELIGREGHGAIQFPGIVSSISWTSTAEGWHGFTVGLRQSLPSIQIVSPADGSVLTPASTVPIVAEAVHLDGTIEMVEFIVNGEKIGERPNSPWTINWDIPIPGTYVLTARARDEDGLQALSAPVTVTVPLMREPPTISFIDRQVILEDTSTPLIPFTVESRESSPASLVITAASSNALLVPPGGISLGGSGPERNIRVTPAPDEFGRTTITLSVSDPEGMTSARQFVLDVLPVNDPPTLNPISDQVISEEAGTLEILLTGLSPGPANESGQSLTIAATSSRPDLIPHPEINYQSPDSSGWLRLTPTPGAAGEAIIEVTVRDSGGTANGGVDTTLRTFRATVVALNRPPTISAIPDQATPQGTSVAIAFVVGDPDTPLDQLKLSGSSSNPSLVSPGGMMFGGGGANRTLTISPSGTETGMAEITVTVSDGFASAKAQFNLSVVEAPRAPEVRLVRPLDYTAFRPEEGRTTVDVLLEAEVPADEGIQRVDFFSGSLLIGSSSAAPYRFEWRNVEIGDYVLRAVAKNHQGLEGTSEPARIAVSDLEGEVAILRSAASLEIAGIRDYLLEIGFGSRVFDLEWATVQALNSFELVILHLGRDGMVTEQVISTLEELQQSSASGDGGNGPGLIGGMPLLIIGGQVTAAASDLSQGLQVRWEELSRLQHVPGTQGSRSIQFVPEPEAFKILQGVFGAVTDFDYGSEVESARARPSATVWGAAGQKDVFLTYPGLDLEDLGEVRGATQNFQVIDGAAGDSIASRKSLFQNTVCWLLRCSDCNNASLSSEPVFEATRTTAGEIFLVPLLILNNGACEVRASRLRVYIPEGLQFMGAEIPRGGSWSYDPLNRWARIELGRVGGGYLAGVAVDLVLSASLAGEYELEMELLSNNTAPRQESRSIVAGESLRPTIRLERFPDGRIRIVGRGAPDQPFRIQRSPSIHPAQWSDWIDFSGPEWISDLILPGNSAEMRFFRAIPR